MVTWSNTSVELKKVWRMSIVHITQRVMLE